jgi:hypothetical protein
MELSEMTRTNRNCLNNSTTKQLFSFSKSNRFRSANKSLNDSFYTLPSIFNNNKKGPTISKANKKFMFQN